MGGLGCHEDKQKQPIGPWVADPVFLPGWCYNDLTLSHFPLLLPDLEQASSLDDKVDLVRTLMGVRALGLACLKAIKITKQSLGFEETVLSHFIWRKLHSLRNFPKLFHTVLLQGLEYKARQFYHRGRTMQNRSKSDILLS